MAYEDGLSASFLLLHGGKSFFDVIAWPLIEMRATAPPLMRAVNFTGITRPGSAMPVENHECIARETGLFKAPVALETP